MDAVKRKYNDEHYDWWSAEGDHKLIKMDSPTERDIAIAHQWHKFFLWEPVAEKAHPVTLFSDTSPYERAYLWSKYSFTGVFLERYPTPYADWCRDIDQFGDAAIYEDVVAYTIMYKRAFDSPYLKELGAIQTECEMLVRNMHNHLYEIDEANATLSSFFSSGRSKAKATQKKEDAEQSVLQLREQINSMLVRANELRAIILGR